MRRGAAIAAWALAVLGAWLGTACSDAPAARQPNVVLVLIDTLRPDHLQAYGYGRETSPYLAELAARGVVFERAYSSSTWTAPATASLFTGLYPNQHGITEGFFVHRARTARDAPDTGATATVSLNRIPDAAPTAPELFRGAGYATFGLSCNVNVSARIGFDRGFERFADFTGPQYGKGAAAEAALEQVRAWKPELAGGRPYFLYLHFNDVHAPWRKRAQPFQPDGSPYGAERAAYDSELRYLDATLRQIGAELAWDGDTLICVVSDHGEEFGEHGALGHGYSLHAELTRIALLLAWPRELAGGRRIAEPAAIIDVLPTLAQLAGLRVPEGLAGVSLAPLLAGQPAALERTLFAMRIKEGGASQLWAAQRGRWKLIVPEGGPARLYDHERDPTEQRDVAAEHPAVAAELAAELGAFRARSAVRGGARIDVQLAPDALKALESLGYTDDKR